MRSDKNETEKEIEALMKRQVFIRRGRNNRLFSKAIMKDVFQVESGDDEDLEELKQNRNSTEYYFRQRVKQKNKGKKRVAKYGNIFDYLQRENPEMVKFVCPTWSSNKKVLQKTFRKLASKSGNYFRDMVCQDESSNMMMENLEKEEESQDIPELILEKTHNNLIKILEDGFNSDEENYLAEKQPSFQKELEETRKHHEKQFKLFKMQKTKGSGHGGSSLVPTQGTSIVL